MLVQARQPSRLPLLYMRLPLAFCNDVCVLWIASVLAGLRPTIQKKQRSFKRNLQKCERGGGGDIHFEVSRTLDAIMLGKSWFFDIHWLAFQASSDTRNEIVELDLVKVSFSCLRRNVMRSVLLILWRRTRESRNAQTPLTLVREARCTSRCAL